MPHFCGPRPHRKAWKALHVTVLQTLGPHSAPSPPRVPREQQCGPVVRRWVWQAHQAQATGS